MNIEMLKAAVENFIRKCNTGQARSTNSYREFQLALAAPPVPIDMVLFCPACGTQHIDTPEIRDRTGDPHDINGGVDYRPDWTNPPHKTHECQTCKHKWRPSAEFTNGVETVELGSSDTRPAIRGDSRLTHRQIKKMLINSDYKAGERIGKKEMAKYTEAAPTTCQAGSDGDCNHVDCPQRLFYQKVCPLHKDRDES